MVRLPRRKVLQLSGGGLLGAISGCTALSQEPAGEPDLSYIRAGNGDPVAHTLHVLILDRTDPVYSASLTVPASESGSPGGTHFADFPTHVGDHLLYVWRDSQPPSKWHEMDFREYDDECIGLVILIGELHGGKKGEILLLTNRQVSECPTRTSEDAN